MDIGPNNIGRNKVPYIWQGPTLSCWRTSLEMLMQWRHGSKYGKPVVEITGPNHAAYGPVRTRHMPLVRTTYCGRNLLDIVEVYGLFEVDHLMGCNDLSTWQTALREYGPILAQGKYGPAHGLPRPFGHVILITGWSRQEKLAYYDPFLGVVPRRRLRPGEDHRDRHSYYTLQQIEDLRYVRHAFFQARKPVPWVFGPPE